jgi:phosphohistidine phosphatase
VQHQSRRIVVVRHAKAEQGERTDFERELAPQGRRDAAAAGRWCADQGLVPDHAWVSAALRAMQTWEALAEGAGWDLEPTADRGLYAAGVDTALDLLRDTPESATTVVIVGHNPTMASLAQLLADGEGDPAAEEGMAEGYPTSALAVFTYDGTWVDLAFDSAHLVGFHVGRA